MAVSRICKRAVKIWRAGSAVQVLAMWPFELGRGGMA